jgi:hypothetical protein
VGSSLGDSNDPSEHQQQSTVADTPISITLATTSTFIIPTTIMSPDTLSLAGKVALVTGSGRENGIGGAIARAFARNGAAVALHHVSESSKPKAEKLAAEIAQEFGVKTTVVQGSLLEPETALKLVEGTLKGLEVDHIDILGTSCQLMLVMIMTY